MSSSHFFCSHYSVLDMLSVFFILFIYLFIYFKDDTTYLLTPAKHTRSLHFHAKLEKSLF